MFLDDIEDEANDIEDLVTSTAIISYLTACVIGLNYCGDLEMSEMLKSKITFIVEYPDKAIVTIRNLVYLIENFERDPAAMH